MKFPKKPNFKPSWRGMLSNSGAGTGKPCGGSHISADKTCHAGDAEDKSPFSKGFPKMSTEDWDKLDRSHYEKSVGPVTDERWAQHKAFSEITVARSQDNPKTGKPFNHYVEADPRAGGYNVYAPVEESQGYYDLPSWAVTGRYGPYLHLLSKPKK